MPEQKWQLPDLDNSDKSTKKKNSSTSNKKKTGNTKTSPKKSTSQKKTTKKSGPKKVPVSGAGSSKSKSKTSTQKKTSKQTPHPKDIDSKKKFFQSLSQEIEEKYMQGDYSFEEKDKQNNKNSKGNTSPKKAINLYKKRAFIFIGLTLLLLAGVFYLSFSRLTITITPEKETINNNVLIDIYNQEKTDYNQKSLTGAVMGISATKEKTFPASGEEVTGEEIEGEVDIINNYSSDQPLVATTRLLSPDEKLYRIENDVEVPAGGRLEDVPIYAEEVSKDMAIEPTQFNIPGLWSGLQDDIYAESQEAFEYKTKVDKYIKQKDFTQAKQELNQLIKEEVKQEANNLYNQKQKILYQTNPEDIEIETSASIGQSKEEFTLQGKNEVQLVVFSKQEAQKLVKEKIDLLIPESKKLVDFEPQDLIYTLDKFNQEEQKATVKVSFTETMALQEGADVVNREKLVNLNEKQIKAYLNDIESIKDYEIDFSPGFINKAPSLVDRIKVKISQ